ncbi:MAG: small-conductance mechanosensitive channel [Chlamydiales bacterium]|jgi:small-conductance mechanosensitive channel
MRNLMLALALWLVATPTALAQADRPSALRSDVLVERTRDALAELADLQATANADREAFTQSEQDMRRALVEFQTPLPQVPPFLSEVEEPAAEDIQAVIEIADAYIKAHERRRLIHDRAASSLETLEALGRSMRPDFETILDRAVALRPLLIEAQRRIDRREVEVDAFDVSDGERSVSEWIVATTELASRREELFAELDSAIEHLAADRTDFAAIEPEDVEVQRLVRGMRISMGVIEEARAASEDRADRLREVRSEALPDELDDIATEWLARRASVDQGTLPVDRLRAALDGVLDERAQLDAPRLEDLSGGEGLPEVREARRQVEYTTQMVAYYEQDLAIVERLSASRLELADAIDELSGRQTLLSRQTGRAFAALRVADERSQAGETVTWDRSADVTIRIVWDAWRALQAAEIDRLDDVFQLRQDAQQSNELESTRALLAKQRQDLVRAQSSLETELSYLEFVARMSSEPDESLIAMLGPEGEIAVAVREVQASIAKLETRAAAAREACLDTARGIQVVEDPYARAALLSRSDELIEIRARLESLVAGELPPDLSELLVADEAAVPAVSIAGEIADAGEMELAELARTEQSFIDRRRRTAQVFLDYFLTLESLLKDMRANRDELLRVDDDLSEQLATRVREEERRYAAAREILRRLDEGRLQNDQRPPELESWVTRIAIQEAGEASRTMERDSGRFADRVAYEIQRLERITDLLPVMRVRYEGADARARLIGRPVAHLTLALTPFEEVDEIERMNLEYEASRAASEFDPVEDLLDRFTSESERERFEATVHAYRLELANTNRMIADFQSARVAYLEIADACEVERDGLEPLRTKIDALVGMRLNDYHSARYSAAISAFPDRRARLEEAFHKTHDGDIRYRLAASNDLAVAADLLFTARVRLVSQRSLAMMIERYFSKVGIEQEIEWFRTRSSSLKSMLEARQAIALDLEGRIASLRTEYHRRVRTNGVRGVAITLLIPFLAYLLVRILRRTARRFETRVIGRGIDDDESDRQRRLKTLSETSAATISVMVWTIATIYVFARLGLDITPIVASASVLGLAVAFGAQALIKDLFYGFFILLENQFTVGDIVKLGAITGTVERISLRVTVLRDLEGVVHYVPNGSIAQVSNKTQGWSRVVMEISVTYKEDPDRVTEILEEILLEMAADETWSRPILEPPVVAGIHSLTDRAVDMRIMIKTRPGKQWEVAREARRRVKRRFDELGIEAPYPQRIVHHVYEDGGEAQGNGGPQPAR